MYFLLKYVLPPVRFTPTQVVLLLITSTFTRVQIQSNLGTTACELKQDEFFDIVKLFVNSSVVSGTKSTLDDLFESLRQLEQEPADIKKEEKTSIYSWCK